ncbi:hypothetical protein [Sphingobacterium multivorum]|uniref:hypothetical protein n=1 Tax=Sphingobacterium multivorum TaxID=28454 RepID=UPI0028A76ADF|nr:hypothetical protein [Sphingobacterium multivorum]
MRYSFCKAGDRKAGNAGSGTEWGREPGSNLDIAGEPRRAAYIPGTGLWHRLPWGKRNGAGNWIVPRKPGEPCCVPTSRRKRNGIVNSKGGIVRPERCKGHSSLCFCPIENGVPAIDKARTMAEHRLPEYLLL